MAKGLSGIQYGKVHVYSTDESLDKLLSTFNKIMSKYKYPEVDDVDVDDLEQDIEDDDEEVDDEEQEVSAPWERARLLKTQEERGQEDGAEK